MQKALFLDRDGVVNVEKCYVHRKEDFDFLEGIFDLCRVAQSRGYLLIIITNQSGIARGYYSEETFHELTTWMRGEFARRGIVIAAIYYCPYHPEAGIGKYRADSFDRKPAPGMLLRAARDFDLDLPQCILIGDRACDMQAAAAAGVGCKILLRTPHTEPEAAAAADRTIDRLTEVFGARDGFSPPPLQEQEKNPPPAPILMKEFITKIFDAHAGLLDVVRVRLGARIEEAAQEMIQCVQGGHTIFWCGNGGSAADAQHFAAELVGRFERERAAMASLALTSDGPVMTSLANDYGFVEVFRRQVEGLVKPRDVLVGISTSGESANILQAIEQANRQGAVTIGLLGRTGGKIAAACRLPIVVPGDNTARIQEMHALIGHTLCDLIERHCA
jgi:D,D-heptose 1,7-bisphosphate phosphatase